MEIAESCSPGRGRPPGPPQLDEFLREVCGRQLAAAAVTAAPSRAAAAKKQDGPHQPAHSRSTARRKRVEMASGH